MPARKLSVKTHPANILLVDDNVHGLTARKTVLEELGHNVKTARNGRDAMDQFVSGKFDLVVTDFKMPAMSGLDLIKGVRDYAPATPVILLSGFVDTLGMNEHSTGADAVIQKSANELPHLIRAVERLLTRGTSKTASRAKKPVRSETKPAKPAAKKKRA